jgi:hypothetical protein
MALYSFINSETIFKFVIFTVKWDLFFRYLAPFVDVISRAATAPAFSLA